MSVHEGVLQVLRIPGDGDCLFSSLSHQIWGSLPGTEQLAFHNRTLRSLVVHHFNQHLAEWSDRIHAQAVAAFTDLGLASVCLELSVSQLVQHYLQCLRQPGFWGGEDAIFVIAQAFGLRVEVFREHSAALTINATGGKTLQIVHRIAGTVGDSGQRGYTHYDSVLSVRTGKCSLSVSYLRQVMSSLHILYLCSLRFMFPVNDFEGGNLPTLLILKGYLVLQITVCYALFRQIIVY